MSVQLGLNKLTSSLARSSGCRYACIQYTIHRLPVNTCHFLALQIQVAKRGSILYFAMSGMVAISVRVSMSRYNQFGISF